MIENADITGLSYDPLARRDTPLARKIKDRIRIDGPISVADYMAACLNDEDHGYYFHARAIGAASDFTTAPEISQVFGELIGIWCAVVWQQMDRPAALNLIELGPGRGTLVADAARAMAKVPGLNSALAIHLIDCNAQFRAEQRSNLKGLQLPLFQYEGIAELQAINPRPEGAAIIIGNEFLDALGTRQLISQGGQWHDRTVRLDVDGNLSFGIGEPISAIEPFCPSAAAIADGTIFEHNPALAGSVMPLLADLGQDAPCAALFIDYGHEQTAPGETLQAVRSHTHAHPLTSPGEADLTAHVDFADVARKLADIGFAVHGPITQTEFLGRLGIVERTSHLMSANPSQAAEIEAGTIRLMAPNGMGTRFKVIGAAGAGTSPLACLETAAT